MKLVLSRTPNQITMFQITFLSITRKVLHKGVVLHIEHGPNILAVNTISVPGRATLRLLGWAPSTIVKHHWEKESNSGWLCLFVEAWNLVSFWSLTPIQISVCHIHRGAMKCCVLMNLIEQTVYLATMSAKQWNDVKISVASKVMQNKTKCNNEMC